ncbi:hypothetical protein GCM10007320_66300 [Pseudorhodoferax aquiterrae]|uniref:Uncharacterized protein n=1 Tax=Pseudorhodoferax aquiterrae TaxID=747304 RepID=A0ABQ3GFZ7_9BURK|nr:hypothetical protein [Pseudorhodoferax aquiterrae]GHD04896.1 hypothetical protein GCM10007320_66300 [Pseudorhodoferax aquiterrae]
MASWLPGAPLRQMRTAERFVSFDGGLDWDDDGIPVHELLIVKVDRMLANVRHRTRVVPTNRSTA